MAKIDKFEDFEVWQRARALATRVYRLTHGERFSRDFGLRDQIQRASVSIVSNIAEGFGRRSNSQFIQFLEIASGSASEVAAQLYVAMDLEYVTKEQFEEALSETQRIGQMLTKLMQHLRSVPNRIPSQKI